MDINQVKASYARALRDTCTITRPPSVSSVADVQCRVQAYKPQEIAGTIMQGDQLVIVLADDLVDGSFPVPPRKGDKVLTSDGRTLTVIYCDPNTRMVDSTLIAYEMQARGD